MLPWQPFLAFYILGAHWRHLKNTTEPSMCGGDAALCQITLTTCCDILTGYMTYKIRKSGFTNSLPNSVVSANNTFKTRGDKFWHNQDIIYNFRAQFCKEPEVVASFRMKNLSKE